MVQTTDVGNQPAILCENFSWLLKNLHDFEPNHKLKDGHWKQPGRGLRREIRGVGDPNNPSPQNGYQHFSHAEYNEFADKPDTNVTNKGIVVINSFGYPVNVERWEVKAPWPVRDSAKKETYNGPGGSKSLGGDPYVCLITARADLRDKKKTRCYVSCNCKDFEYSFLHDLKDAKYTDPNRTVPPKGKGVNKNGKPTTPVPQTAAVCKHIYAILKLFYSKFINAEGGPSENPEFNVEQPEEEPIDYIIPPIPPIKKAPPIKKPPTRVPPVPPVITPGKKPKPLTKTQIKLAAQDAIIDALMDADRTIPSANIDSYQDPRKFSKSKNAALSYHKYKFAVRVETADGKASIYYMNPNFAGSASGQKLLMIPKHSKKDSYYLFTPAELHTLVSKYSTEFSPQMQTKLDKLKQTGKIVRFTESVLQYSEEMQILNESSPIMQSLMELNFRINKCQ
jgi:hypothetical protein